MAEIVQTPARTEPVESRASMAGTWGTGGPRAMTGPPSGASGVRIDWTRAEIAALLALPFTELVFRAATVHRAHHAPDQVQLCTLLSIKTEIGRAHV